MGSSSGVTAAGAAAAAEAANEKRARDGTVVSLDNVRDKNVQQLRKLNSVLFPVRYAESYYTDAIAAGEFARLAYYGDVYVGAVVCRLERISPDSPSAGHKCYIMTLGVLAPYRRLGVGSVLLHHILSRCSSDSKSNIKEVYLHVQTSNDEALKFYAAHGFSITGTIANYYRRITPPDCYILTKDLTVPDHPSPNGVPVSHS